MDRVFLILIIAYLLGNDAIAAGNVQDNNCVGKITLDFERNDIFDLKDPESIFIHSWANFLHVRTKELTLKNEASFFLKKCQPNQTDLADLERYFRSKPYIRDARVRQAKDGKVIVKTWDSWSLMPTTDIGRQGGKNKFALGLKEQNFLGLGIDTEIEYFTNDQRKGYKFETNFPLFQGLNMEARIRLTDSDDGNSQAFFLNKPFVSFDTENAFSIGTANYDIQDTLYQNGKVANIYRHERDYAEITLGVLANNTEIYALRYTFGYVEEEHRFNMSDFIKSDNNNFRSFFLPKDRQFYYPFFGIEYIEKEYKKLCNVYLINHTEDVNLGLRATFSLGRDFSGGNQAASLIWQSSISKGIRFNQDTFALLSADFSGQLYRHSEQKHYLANVKAEYFNKLNNLWAMYLKGQFSVSQNQYLDQQIVIGGDTGVRGYPLQYQHGKHNVVLSAEARYYPQIDLYKIFELGGVAFIDSGRTYGDSIISNNKNGWLTSVGVGVRLFLKHSSDNKVIHIDLASPISSDDNVNNLELRITTKHAF